MDPRARASRAKPAEPSPLPQSVWGGPVVLIRLEAPVAGVPNTIASERYAEVTGVDGRSALVRWDGAPDPEALHLFSRSTGACLESPGGVMRGYSVAPWELDRVRPTPR